MFAAGGTHAGDAALHASLRNSLRIRVCPAHTAARARSFAVGAMTPTLTRLPCSSAHTGPASQSQRVFMRAGLGQKGRGGADTWGDDGGPRQRQR